MGKKIIIILVFVAGLVIGGAGFYSFYGGGGLSSEEAGKIAMDFINKAIAEQNVTASLVSISEGSGVYKIHLKIEDKEYDSFISKDGRYLFSTAFDLLANQEASLENFAKCLTDNGAKFYGTFWCSHCKNQKEMFGQAAQYLPYIECSTEDSQGQLDVCKDNNITGYPTWEFADGSRESGEVSLEKLAEKTSCQLPQ